MYFSACLQINAQQFYNEDGKYYEFAYVWYQGHHAASDVPYIEMPTVIGKGVKKSLKEYTDDNGKKIVFKNFMACINYFMAKGWTVMNIKTAYEADLGVFDNHFYIRREITKEQAEKLAQDCIKELKE